MEKAIILSAGQGSRLGHLTDDMPQCLIDFGGRTLLDDVFAGFGEDLFETSRKIDLGMQALEFVQEAGRGVRVARGLGEQLLFDDLQGIVEVIRQVRSFSDLSEIYDERVHWQAALEALSPCMKPDAWLYVESPADAVPALPGGWRLHREGRTREVRHALYRRVAQPADTLPADVDGAVPAGG